MVGKGRLGKLTVLGVHSADPVLSLLAALGLAQTAGTALIVDLVGDVKIGPGRSLADLVEVGPSLAELRPGRPGVAVMMGGGLTVEEAVPCISELAGHWPALVIRHLAVTWPGPSVPVIGMLPGMLRQTAEAPAVWQPTSANRRPAGPGPVLPSLSPRLVAKLLGGREAPRSRWVRAWDRVWEMPWG